MELLNEQDWAIICGLNWIGWMAYIASAHDRDAQIMLDLTIKNQE